jgi:6-phosphogluconate dehydrogenase
MESIGSEADPRAGHLKLDNLCRSYDNNQNTSEGSLALAPSKPVAGEPEAILIGTGLRVALGVVADEASILGWRHSVGPNGTALGMTTVGACAPLAASTPPIVRKDRTMQLGMIGLGRMGANMVRRLLLAGHQCVVNDIHQDAVDALTQLGATGSTDPAEFVRLIAPPRHIWLMVPAANVDSVLERLLPLLAPGDTIIDGGNSYYSDDLRRAALLAEQGLHYVDVGTSGGVWGLERGYCLMIGGEAEIVQRLDPIFRALAPGVEAAPRTPGRHGDPTPAEYGYLHCGPNGAGHFVKMVHNGIEYGIMAAYAEGMNVLKHANVGKRPRAVDAETTPLRDPARYQYDLNLPDIAEVWRRGSVIASWLLDLTASALHASPELAEFEGRVSDSGEGRWTVTAAIDEGVPVPVLSAALYERFSSRGEAEFANKLLSAMRYQFGGHREKTPDA